MKASRHNLLFSINTELERNRRQYAIVVDGSKR